MPLHMMNGVFVVDLTRGLPSPGEPFEYARHYRLASGCFDDA